VVTVSGSPGFRASDVADFGWGRPWRTENVSREEPGLFVVVS